MKEYIHKNITGTDEQTLVERNIKKDIDIRGFTICNNHATDSTYVDLYLKRINESFHTPGKDGNWDSVAADITTLYIMRDLEITSNNTLILEPREVDYNAKEFSLMLQLNAADSTVDVIINFEQER